MSAIGSYFIIDRRKFGDLILLAATVKKEVKGKWIFQKTELKGLNEFLDAWRQAVIKEAFFDFSGYVLGSYLDVQAAINAVTIGCQLENAAAAKVLQKVFTWAIAFEQHPDELPALDQKELRLYCDSEWGADAETMTEALQAAHEFYQRGLAEISADHVVVFVIK